MGFLHEGHLSLLREGRRRIPTRQGELVLSIFVNPTQFPTQPEGAEDLSRYPRDEAGDLEKARGCGVDVVFCPSSPRELYPPGAATWVNVETLDAPLCGASRPGHFRGVCTIVTKLWSLVQPSVGIFGHKDYQQLAILRRMHRDLFLAGEIVGMPIVRADDGLALSSRNANLDPESRAQARAIPGFLATVRQRFGAGERETSSLLEGAVERLAPGQVDYAAIVDAVDLQPLDRIDHPALCALAVYVGGVRLIDNTVLEP